MREPLIRTMIKNMTKQIDEVEYALEGENVCYMINKQYVKKQAWIKWRSERVRSSVHDRGDMRIPASSPLSDSHKESAVEEYRRKNYYSVMDGGVG